MVIHTLSLKINTAVLIVVERRHMVTKACMKKAIGTIAGKLMPWMIVSEYVMIMNNRKINAVDYCEWVCDYYDYDMP